MTRLQCTLEWVVTEWPLYVFINYFIGNTKQMPTTHTLTPRPPPKKKKKKKRKKKVSILMKYLSYSLNPSFKATWVCVVDVYQILQIMITTLIKLLKLVLRPNCKDWKRYGTKLNINYTQSKQSLSHTAGQPLQVALNQTITKIQLRLTHT